MIDGSKFNLQISSLLIHIYSAVFKTFLWVRHWGDHIPAIKYLDVEP